jgi:hypothetical protein
MGDQRGQTTVEWTALVLFVTAALGAVVTFGPRVDGRSLGGALAHSLVCAVKGGCDDGRGQLARAYGESDADLLRRYAPNVVYEPGTYTLPVDFRDCRSHECSDAPDDPDLDVHASKRGALAATAFTRVIRRDGRTFLQYWLYYPDSTSTVGNVAGAWNTVARAVTPVDRNHRESYPGYHPDDWESYQVRIDADGSAWVRASSHHGYQACKRSSCTNKWARATGWTRVSRGSHAGHIPDALPGVDVRERTTTAAGLRLVPIESIPHTAHFEVSPPWAKRVYRDPTSESTG